MGRRRGGFVDRGRFVEGNKVSSEEGTIITELKVIAQDEWREHELSVRTVCAEAAAMLKYQLELLEKMGKHEKELRDELDTLQGIIR